MPRENREYWGPKLARNQERDKTIVTALQTNGWRVYVAWECQINAAPVRVADDIVGFIRKGRS